MKLIKKYLKELSFALSTNFSYIEQNCINTMCYWLKEHNPSRWGNHYHDRELTKKFAKYIKTN